jgi:hypothetical protein
MYGRGVTRGDSFVGEDVTSNVRTIMSVPLRLMGESYQEGRVEVRGEIVMLKRDFEALNERRPYKKPIFINQRTGKSVHLNISKETMLHCTKKLLGSFTPSSYIILTKDIVEAKHPRCVLKFLEPTKKLTANALCWTVAFNKVCVLRFNSLQLGHKAVVNSIVNGGII